MTALASLYFLALFSFLVSGAAIGWVLHMQRKEIRYGFRRLLLARKGEGERKALRAAVLAIYFHDNSDYGSALWEVIDALDPAIGEILADDEQRAVHLVAPDLDD